MTAMKPECVPVSDSELHREMLLAKRRQLLRECSAERSVLEEWGRVADDDQPSMLHDQFVTLQQQGLAYQTLKLVDAALERMASGDFGACLACGEAISNRRLNAIPWAEYCIRCQESAAGREQTASGRAA
jgi:DnaK suppressor protein